MALVRWRAPDKQRCSFRPLPTAPSKTEAAVTPALDHDPRLCYITDGSVRMSSPRQAALQPPPLPTVTPKSEAAVTPELDHRHWLMSTAQETVLGFSTTAASAIARPSIEGRGCRHIQARPSPKAQYGRSVKSTDGTG
jgi:hypothetical protein